MCGTLVAEVEIHVFLSVCPTNADMELETGFLGGLFRKILPYLIKDARAVGKEVLRAGINVI